MGLMLLTAFCLCLLRRAAELPCHLLQLPCCVAQGAQLRLL